MSRKPMLEEGVTLDDLMARFSRPGPDKWIGVRPLRGGEMEALDSALLLEGRGIEGDHRAQRRDACPLLG